MGDAALNLAVQTVPAPTSWPLRLAQQAFSALLEDSRRQSGFRVGSRRTSARSALSALSVDDRGPLERWLAMQVLTTPAGETTANLDVLATVDARLTSAVRVNLMQLAARTARGGARDPLGAGRAMR